MQTKPWYIILFRVFLFTYGCTSYNKSIVDGHWYTCAENGDYIEWHMIQKKYCFTSDFGLHSGWGKYQVSGDTLIQFDETTYEDSLVLVKAIIVPVTENQIRLEYNNLNETWILNKINEPVNLYETKEEIKAATILRARSVNCKGLDGEEYSDNN